MRTLRRFTPLKRVSHAGDQQSILDGVQPFRAFGVAGAHFMFSAVRMGEVTSRRHKGQKVSEPNMKPPGRSAQRRLRKSAYHGHRGRITPCSHLKSGLDHALRVPCPPDAPRPHPLPGFIF